MAASTSRTSPGNYIHKVLLAALLGIAAAASFLPGSSACTSLVAQTCGRTSNQRLCVSLLESSNQSRSATTVRELAIIGLKAARRSALRARLRAWDLSYGAPGTPADRLVARCNALYLDCLRAAASALARVTYMPAYDKRVADAVSALRVFPEKCQGLFDAQGIASPLEKVNRETEEKLGIASEIVHLLR
jgi:pectinesterase inhibitor-like protein